MDQDQSTLAGLAQKLDRRLREINDAEYSKRIRQSHSTAPKPADTELPSIFEISTTQYLALPKDTKDKMMLSALRGALSRE